MTTIPTLNRQWLKLQERNRLHWRSTRRWKRSYVPESHEKLLLFDMLLTYIIYATNNTVLWSPQYNEGERTKLWSPACMSNSRCLLHITSHTVPILTAFLISEISVFSTGRSWHWTHSGNKDVKVKLHSEESKAYSPPQRHVTWNNYALSSLLGVCATHSLEILIFFPITVCGALLANFTEFYTEGEW